MACPFANPRHLFQDLAAIRLTPGLEYNETLNGYVVSRYDDIISVLDKPEIFSSRPTVPEFPPPVKSPFSDKVPEKGTLLAWDNPDHDRLRKSVSSFFVPRRLERFEPLLRATAHDLINGFVDAGTAEIKSAFALPLPLRAIVTVAGLDPERWQWIGRCLSLFGGITKTEGDVGIEQKVQDVLDLHEYIAGVIEQRRTDRRDDLISHIWNERDAKNVKMTDFEHLGMIPGLLLAGHETTTNMLTMGLSHLLHYGLWDEVSASDETRRAAIEELLRFESAITGMPRLVTAETKVGGTVLRPGDRLFVAYNSGSRDAAKFEDPHLLDFKRRPTQHLGFGRGIHACLGAPFARLLLRTELSVLRERLPALRLETPYEDIQYHPVHEGRAPAAVRIAWDPPLQERTMSRGQVEERRSVIRLTPRLDDQNMRVTRITAVATDVVEITLRCEDGSEVPVWSPGAHIDVKVGDFGYRQYSLCSDPSDRRHLRIAILKGRDSGASQFLHGNTKAGTRFAIRGPRNNFDLELAVRRTIFIAGGIGITPIIPMVAAAATAGLDYSLVYLGSSRDNLAFANTLSEKHGNKCIIWASDENSGRRFDLADYLQKEDLDGLRVYCCGPEALLVGVEDCLIDAPAGVLRLERFTNPAVAIDSKNTAFNVVLARSGRVLRVPEDRSVLDVINEAGAGVISTCNKGLCGTCEVKVIQGLPEHRDAVLTALERAEGRTMMPCVSRCSGKQLSLDLW
ncbi:related to cytochrome P450 [Cephalotrichum gorgonifer]|uniref:Related to cytochrome P450 n=1 Tax=Cephalotrichum gorgonifer TaxID=2041049 RepID=A0AAE8MVD4_9PEZI|nr:related to cytochrome P450 [Cephalotrichum gorgonifer]